MSGSEATKKIREIEKEKNLKKTIIIAFTANVLEEDKDRFKESGMDFHLSKPFDIKKFKEILLKIKN
jgi:CheY-like chemotaxis protein